MRPINFGRIVRDAGNATLGARTAAGVDILPPIRQRTDLRWVLKDEFTPLPWLR